MKCTLIYYRHKVMYKEIFQTIKEALDCAASGSESGNIWPQKVISLDGKVLKSEKDIFDYWSKEADRWDKKDKELIRE